MTQVRMLTHITGTRDGVEWPDVGGTIDVPDQEALDLVAVGYAEVANGTTRSGSAEVSGQDAKTVEDSSQASEPESQPKPKTRKKASKKG